TGKVVVYSSIVGKVKRIAQVLDYSAYYYNIVGKISILSEFINGKQQVIIVISALGIEVDIPDI
ncbi:uncharacterized protein BDZ99DRAFT_384984, partial [Mytilinidion resinicola]